MILKTDTFAELLARELTIPALLVLASLMAIAWWQRDLIAQFLKVSVRLGLWVAASLALILVATLRFWEFGGFSELFWLFDGPLWAHAFVPTPNWLLNVLLYVPAGVLLDLAGIKYWKSWLYLAGLAFAIETVQGFTGWGVGDPADFVANITGALIGAGATKLFLAWRASRASA